MLQFTQIQMTWAGVVPFTGTWIETRHPAARRGHSARVVPFTGTWIETQIPLNASPKIDVVPFTGTWIETRGRAGTWSRKPRRPLHGDVD